MPSKHHIRADVVLCANSQLWHSDRRDATKKECKKKKKKKKNVWILEEHFEMFTLCIRSCVRSTNEITLGASYFDFTGLLEDQNKRILV